MPEKTKNITYKEPPETITTVNELDAVYGRYSYADYLSWKIKERLELIKGKLFRMSPAPICQNLTGAVVSALRT